MSDDKDVNMDGDDDDSSSEEEVDIDPADEQQIMALEAQLEASPTVYDTHTQLIGLLHKCKLKARLRSARQRMHELFPFNESQWMDWINDEMENISDQEDVQRVRNLFVLATQDYISVTIWESYLEFLQAADPEVAGKTAAGAETLRTAAEAALTAAGLHLAEGHHLWQTYRSYEQSLAEGSGDEKQLERVRSLYHRQLQLPNVQAQDLLQEYETWESQQGKGSVPDHIRAAAQRSAAAAQLRSAHEAAVSADKAADANLLAAYMAYIQLEKAQKDPARVQVLYERAVAVFPVTSELWLQYTKYLETELKVPALVNKAYGRAVRNCPWVGGLWCAALRAHERLGGEEDQHQDMANRALAAGLQGPEDYLSVMLARADCLRHQLPSPADSSSPPAVKLRSWFSHSRSTLAQLFPDYTDRSLRLAAYWAAVEGVMLGDLTAMRAVWEDTVKGKEGKHYETWLAWITMERGLRQIAAARSLFKRCYSRRFDEGGQLVVAQEWIRFEREEGSAEDLFNATLKVEPAIEEATAAAAAAADQPAAAAARAAAQNAKKLTREEVRAMRRAHDPNYKERKPGVKRDLEESPAAGYEQHTSSPQKRSKDQAAADQDASMADATDAGFDAAAAAAARQPPVYSNEHTVFVKGLGFDVHEEDLRSLFAELGVKSVRIGKDKFTGESRGFAYVDFDTDEAVQEASKKDGEVVNGRKLFIAKSQPPGGGRGRGGRGGRGGPVGRGGRGGRGTTTEDYHYAGGRGDGGGRGDRGGRMGRGRDGPSRGRHGLGFNSRGDVPSAAHGNMGHMRHHLELQDDKPGARLPQLVPRALLNKQPAGQQQQQQGGAAADVQPKSNDDFRKMFLKK